MIPWKEVSAAIVKVFTLTQEMQANKADIKRLSEKVDGLSKEVQSLNQKRMISRLPCSERITKISGRRTIFGICARTTSAGIKTRRGSARTSFCASKISGSELNASCRLQTQVHQENEKRRVHLC